MKYKEALQCLCRNCRNHSECQGTGCTPKAMIASLIEQYGEDTRTEPEDDGCAWCEKDWMDEFAVFDVTVGHFVPDSMVKYCPFCGKELKKENNNETI